MPAPPGVTLGYRMGGTTSPSTNELTKVARLILDNCGIPFSQNRIVRLVLTFKDRAPNADGFVFFQYLAAAVQMSEAQKRCALTNPDIARVVAYADPTGESAVNNVMRKR